MTERVKHSTDQSPDAASAASLLRHYGFDLGDNMSSGHAISSDTIAQLLSAWQEQYSASWIRLATVEALYQGRYKAISVEQILALWQRRGQPMYHFNHEFERLICDRLPQPLEPAALSTQAESSTRSTLAIVPAQSYSGIALPLSNVQTSSALHSPEAMQALKTLHNYATESSLASSSTESSAEPEEPLLVQTYSYTLRSDEPPKPSTQEQSESVAQSDGDPALQPSFVPLDGADDAAVDNETTSDLALSSALPNVEPTHTTHSPVSNTALPLPVNNGVQAQPTQPQAESIARILQHLDNQELSARAMFPGFGLLTGTLKPKLSLHLTARYQPIWLTDPSSKQPIHQFTPAPEASDFCNKLKAVTQPPDEVPENTIAKESYDPSPSA